MQHGRLITPHRANSARTLGCAWLLAAAACGDGGTELGGTDAGGESDAAKPDAASASDAGPDANGPPRCSAPDGVSSALHTVADVVTLLNAMPKPVTLPCFLETLPRPLSVSAANSLFSLQPAAGARSPRIFLHLGGLTLSVVPEGTGAPLLELAERRSETTSLKAELAFPITQELAAAAPYERLRFDDTLTNCGVCHQGEQPAADVGLPLAMISQALRPRGEQRVPLELLLSEARECDPAQEPERCALLEALVGPSPAPREVEFPASYNTFF